MDYNKMLEAAEYLKNNKVLNPEIGIVLGSGLGHFADSFTEKIVIPFKDIPNFKATHVEGHAGNLIFGKINNKNVIALQGRYHFYEGHSAQDVVFPIRVLGLLGVKKLIVTNAAGGINPKFTPGDLVYIKDHLNLTGANPLMGQNIDELGTRFPDMTKAYSKNLINKIELAAQKIKYNITGGVYAGLTGPCYETPAEIHMLKVLGSDMVGMSTVMEVIAANHMGIETAGISCITNMAAGMLDVKLDHSEVKKTADQIKDKFVTLLTELITIIDN